MQNRKNVHLRHVSRKGCGKKEIYSIGEPCWVQNVKSNVWDRQAIITGIRTACDGTIVSYDIEIGGVKSTTDFLDKSTWVLAAIILVLILISNVTLMNDSENTDSILIDESVPEQTIPEIPEQTIPEIPAESD